MSFVEGLICGLISSFVSLTIDHFLSYRPLLKEKNHWKNKYTEAVEILQEVNSERLKRRIHEMGILTVAAAHDSCGADVSKKRGIDVCH